MHRTVLLGLGLVLGVVGPLFFIVGYQNSDPFVCTNVGVPNCFTSGYNTSVALFLEIAGLYMTVIGIGLVALVILDNLQNKTTHVAPNRNSRDTPVTNPKNGRPAGNEPVARAGKQVEMRCLGHDEDV